MSENVNANLFIAALYPKNKLVGEGNTRTLSLSNSENATIVVQGLKVLGLTGNISSDNSNDVVITDENIAFITGIVNAAASTGSSTASELLAILADFKVRDVFIVGTDAETGIFISGASENLKDELQTIVNENKQSTSDIVNVIARDDGRFDLIISGGDEAQKIRGYIAGLRAAEVDEDVSLLDAFKQTIAALFFGDTKECIYVHDISNTINVLEECYRVLSGTGVIGPSARGGGAAPEQFPKN